MSSRPAPGESCPGQQVAALAGRMGRAFDGGYAEYTCVPVNQVVPFASSLDWPTLGAIPVMLLTANGSLDVGLDAKPVRPFSCAVAHHRSGC